MLSSMAPNPQWGGSLLLLVLLIGGTCPAAAQRFLTDDPLWSDPDRMDVALPDSTPATMERMGPFKLFSRAFRATGDRPQAAVNVNTVEGVPNSSWYTNRHYRHPMDRAALRRGPNEEPGPAPAAWRVVHLPREGPLPRAVIRDSTGRRFRLLFDDANHPEMATGAAMIGSRLFHALGYNVPQHWLRQVHRDRFVPMPDAITHSDLDSLLAGTARQQDSTYRVLATRLPGVVRKIGPFRFQGTRSDDANDIFPHEHRRELRGLRIFAAWMHHSKIRARHTLDAVVQVEGRRFVRHYLTDLHLTLGSAGATPKPRWSGHEYVLEVDQVLERIATLGLSGGDWAESDPPDWPALGHFGVGGFEPRSWRPEWPNPAFQRADSSDAFWAAKQVRQFSRADLEAVVGTAEYSSSQVENHVVLTLLQRRNAIGQAYLHWTGGLDRFAVQGNRLTFEHLPARHGLASDSLQGTVIWHVFNNREDRVEEHLEDTELHRESIPLPSSRAAFLRATIRMAGSRATQVYLRRKQPAPPEPDASYEVVGVDRDGTHEGHQGGW